MNLRDEDIQKQTPLPGSESDEIESVEMSEEEAQAFVNRMVEKNAEVLRGLAQR